MDNWQRLRAVALMLPLMAASAAFGQSADSQSTDSQSTGGNVYHVYPLGYTGPMAQPGFIGLLAAYFLGSSNIDGGKSFPIRVKPGDTILIHAGTYIDTPAHYEVAGGLGTPFDGTYYLTAKGTARQPIKIMAAGDGPVIFDGGSIPGVPRNQVMFNVMAADYHQFSGITVQNTNIAFLVGIKDEAGASGVKIQNVTINNVGYGACGTTQCLPSKGPSFGLNLSGFSFASH